MRRSLIFLCTALTVVLFLAGGVSFAYTNFIEIPPLTEPYSTERPPWLPPPAPQGDLTFYTVESEFEDACGGVTTEDFSCSAAQPGGVCSGITPLNSTTDDGCFNACLNEGFEFTAIGIGDYAAVGTGFLGVGLPAIGPNYFTDEASWTFSPSSCIGFKVLGDLINPVDVDCTFHPSGAVATIHGSLAGVFIGALDPGGITAVDCVEQVDGSADLYGKLLSEPGDDGGLPPPVAATSTWGMIALIGILMVGSLFFLRRRAEA